MKQDSGYLFTQPTTGLPHTETSMKQMWRSFKQALDLDMGAQMVRGAIDPETSVVADDLTPYCLRHTYATDLQSADVPINVAKDFLGHKSITMTSHIYTHLSDEAFTNASLKMLSFATESRKKAQKKSRLYPLIFTPTLSPTSCTRTPQKNRIHTKTKKSAASLATL